jgi:NAD(P)-dependent dehydrogenase (short-subunit alcohol dehydrogenase family)
MPSDKSALIVGAGDGISAAFARRLVLEGYAVALASRTGASHAGSIAGCRAYTCDAASAASVAELFARLDAEDMAPTVVLYNASARVTGPVADLDPDAVAQALAVTALGGFHVAQQAARRMLARNEGTILFTGASASVKGFARSAPFAMGKFALRGLAQSLARELQPQGIHVAHVVIDGGVASARRPVDPARPDALLDPDAVAGAYMDLLRQPRSAWSTEVELRPWVEAF